MKFSLLTIKRFQRDPETLVFESPEMLQNHVNDIVAREIEAIYESGYDFNQTERLAIAEILEIMERTTLNLVTIRAFTRDVIGPHASRKAGGLMSFEFKHNQEVTRSAGVKMGQVISMRNIAGKERFYDGSKQKNGFVVTFNRVNAEFPPRHFGTFGWVQDSIKPEIVSEVGDGTKISLWAMRSVGPGSFSSELVATYDAEEDAWIKV